MEMYQRQLNLPSLLAKKSFFLLGPRATGKSFLIREQLKEQALVLDLLRSDLYLRLSAQPWDLEALIDADRQMHDSRIVVIDEVQKIPHLLDEVHRLIESKRIRFLLTGSSARKLKQGHANLLAGRAWTAHLHPLSWIEIPQFDLARYLRFGGLPAVYSSPEPQEELLAYVRTYLYEEIQAEGLVRKLPQFSRFLTLSALANGQLLNFSQIASDAAVPASTIREYYTILMDTLVGFMLTPWTQSKRRKAISTAKFYWFDTGVAHTLAHTYDLQRNSDLYGRSFEHWICLELRSYLDYHRYLDELSFWRSIYHQEVDFVIGDHTAIEVKASHKLSARDFKGLKALQEEDSFKNFYLISHDPLEQKQGAIQCLYWKTFLKRLWQGEIF